MEKKRSLFKNKLLWFLLGIGVVFFFCGRDYIRLGIYSPWVYGKSMPTVWVNKFIGVVHEDSHYYVHENRELSYSEGYRILRNGTIEEYDTREDSDNFAKHKISNEELDKLLGLAEKVPRTLEQCESLQILGHSISSNESTIYPYSEKPIIISDYSDVGCEFNPSSNADEFSEYVGTLYEKYLGNSNFH